MKKLFIAFFLSILILIPQYSVKAATEQPIRIMTYNILWPGQTDARLNEIAETIKRNQADIVAFQEVRGFIDDGPSWDSSWRDRSNTGRYIQSRLSEIGWEMPYISQRFDRDLRVLSRFPIESYQELNVENSQTMVINVGQSVLPQGKLRLFNLHLLPPGDGCVRTHQLASAAKNYHDYPQVLLGDFNCISSFNTFNDFLSSNNYQLTCKDCSDTVNDEILNRFSDQPVTHHYAIDHIVVDKGVWQIQDAYTDTTRPGLCDSGLIPACASDHFPVVAEVKADFIPNCSNISGPAQLTVGEQGSFSADFYSPQGDLTGQVFLGDNVDDRVKLQVFSGNSGTMNFTWQADQPGEYHLYCRSWNNGIAECRPPQFVDGPPRYACQGPGYHKVVQVVEQLCSVCPTGLPKDQGNADCNNSINLLDFAAWLRVFKTGGAEAEKQAVNFDCAESDLKQIIDLADFTVWLDNFMAGF